MSAHTTTHHDAHHAGGHTEPHVASFASYLGIFGALMVLTAITVGVAQINLGALNVVVAVLIAMVKASIVVLFFMHVKYSSPLIKLTAACGFIWLIFMFVLTFTDYAGRQMIDPPQAWITPAAAAPAPAVEHE